MKHIRKITLLCLILSILVLTSCGVTIHEGIGEGDAMDKSNNVTWYHASTCYEAVTLAEKAGKLIVKDRELVLYALPQMDPGKWLATEDANILYAAGVTLPTLRDMEPTALNFYLDGTAKHKLFELKEEALLNTIIKDYSENQSVLYPASTPYKTYCVRFASETYPDLYYTLTYVEYASDYIIGDANYGKYFLYDRFDQKFVPVGDEIHKAIGIE